ncbi:DNA mismatch repair protein MutS, core [Artemisia annua]|uniref:DNA mismatch repair protein MutS, core n=1 Tax=Artemisia annua TaxID=35608 RepID=A0A2U1NAM0_ARTAN|nr:DNA mismatch repair protein MutS, core [Artemisia annua]
MHNHGSCIMDFHSIPIPLVKSGIQDARRGFPLDGNEAIALVSMLQLADSLQTSLNSAIKQDSIWLQRFMPIADMIIDMSISRPLLKFILKLVDLDGSVKDSASPTLKRSREQVRLLETKLYRLMESLISNDMKEKSSSVEVSNTDGRWCIKSATDQKRTFDGLLLSSGSGTGTLVEPLSAVPLNDELQQARASVAKAEADVLLEITHKMQTDLDDIENLFNTIIRLDVINARATYSISFGGSYPDIFSSEDPSVASQLSEVKWKLYLPKAYHPILLQQHREKMHKAMKDVSDARAEIRRRRQQIGIVTQREEETSTSISLLEAQVAKLKKASPVPFDIFVAQKTRVLVVTGPNTGGKTIFLKTVGLAAMMAKAGLYVLSSEPVKMPWFDSIFADIGDEQSLSQSLSTFSGHLKQTSDILSQSTSQSLVLLDEVGAGTNPLEGAALGMSLLECFAEAGALLTMATTHHGELKTLKYSNDAFENACMEFDEVNLKPTYRILWGIPGRSNAINIAERLGLPKVVVGNARELHGTASAEINEVIEDMEKLKQKLHEHIHEARHHLKLAKELHRNLVVSDCRIKEHATSQKYRKVQEISDGGGAARSLLHKKVRQRRASPVLASNADDSPLPHKMASFSSQSTLKESDTAMVSESNVKKRQLERSSKVVKPGDMVHVSKFNKKAAVLKVDPSKEEILVQLGNMKLKLTLADVVI